MLNIYIEREWLEHAGVIENKWRTGNVIWVGVERDLTSIISDKLKFLNADG